MAEQLDVPHPGKRIRTEVIPAGMAVTKAAQLIGVGRPALSNLLNGNAALSSDMAARLAKAFHYPLEDLMDMQSRHDAAQARLKDAPDNTKAYVPPYLAIKANDVEQWVGHNIPARSRLSVFLRTLVHSTGHGLTKVDFPGNDDAERPGWDGRIEATEGTPWIPSGRSGWEFGTNEDPKAKAESDFEKSVKALGKKEREETTFVFVTPRRWTGKTSWVTAKKAKSLWKDIRAYDASDIEQWLEQSLAAQAWFANETNIPAQHVRSLDRCWLDWASVSAPPLTGALFSSAIEATKRIMLSRLSKPPEKPVLMAADSTEEALAFLAQLLSERGGEELASYRDRVLVFDRPHVLPRLAAGAQTFIPVVFTREVERELAPFARSMHSIVIYPRNATAAECDIVLGPANYETFNRSLEEMGKDRDAISQLANASGRSLTVLRRQLATVLAVKKPEWAAERETATSLVPFLFVGAWDSQNETDRQGLSLLAGVRSYQELEKDCQYLAQLNDAPIWSIGHYRGIISKIDLLYSIAGAVTRDDLERYFSMAQMVLGEDDPALDLADDQRWAASIHGKTREFSSAFRNGISETLVLLAVHGGNLFKNGLGVDTEREAAYVVRNLLPTPLNVRILEANNHDLPTYAEAAPDEFLSILERDLKTEMPAVLGLLRPAGHSIFGSPSRTGLLWALEGLSWNPETLPRAAFILARLAEVEITDNWINKPTHSLGAIFRAWMPQTAAGHQARVDLMKRLVEKFPNIAWKLCVTQFGSNHQVGDYSHKPRWRPDGYGFGEPFPTWEPIINFMREMVKIALSWKDHSLSKLCDLVDRLPDLTDADQIRVWALIDDWAKTRASDTDKAAMREKIRVSTLSRRVTLRAKKDTVRSLAAAGKAVYASLEPSDLLNKYAWLFKDGWVEDSADELEDIDKIDFHKRDEDVQNLRIEALRDVWKQRGADGLLALSERGRCSWTIGMLMASTVLPEHELYELLKPAAAMILAAKEGAQPHKNLFAGALHAFADNIRREAVFTSATKGLSEDDTVKLLVLAPYRKGTWSLVDALSERGQRQYWDEVAPNWIHDSDSENNESIERLLKAGRPRAAFVCAKIIPKNIDPRLLFKILSEIALIKNDHPGDYILENYHVREAFKHLNSSQVLTLEEKAGLEFAYIEVLSGHRTGQNGHRTPNLERYVEAHPELFVQAITWTYKRNDGGSDPAEFQVPPERIESMANRGYKLIEAIERIPGHNDLDELETPRLAKWIATVRQASAELSRADIADVCIGKVLSCAPIGSDGTWPCEPVRDVMEEIQSEPMMRGAHTGIYNSRGVHSGGNGGDQERELASKYRKWGLALQTSHPFVASKLLLSLAKTYDHEASHEDEEARLNQRLR